MAMRTAAFLSAIKRGAHFIFQANPGRNAQYQCILAIGHLTLLYRLKDIKNVQLITKCLICFILVCIFAMILAFQLPCVIYHMHLRLIAHAKQWHVSRL